MGKLEGLKLNVKTNSGELKGLLQEAHQVLEQLEEVVNKINNFEINVEVERSKG